MTDAADSGSGGAAAAVEGDRGLAGFDLFDPHLQQAPHGWYERLREHGGVHHIAANDVYLVLDHALILEVLRQPEVFSSRFGSNREPPPAEVRDEVARIMADGLPLVPALLDNDPPSHTRFRRLVNRAFTPKMVAGLRPATEQTCDRLIDSWRGRSQVELVSEFAVPLPIEVIAMALNVPDERKADFKRWSDDNIAAIGARLAPDDYVSAQRGIAEMQRFFVEQLEARRAEPRDDFLTDLLNAHVGADEAGGDDRPLELPELVRILQMLLVAGNETTTKFLTETVRLVAEQPGGWPALRERPDQIPGLVEEGLRISAPTQGSYRIAAADTELGGTLIPKGARVVVMFSAANRDPALFSCPHDFQPDRANVREHLAFGKGIHFCVGAALSRMEGNVAFERLVGRLADVRIAPDNTFEYTPSFMLRGLKRLSIEIDLD